MSKELRHVDLTYDNANSHDSAIDLVTTLLPDWKTTKDTIRFIRFTDGITNTLMKAVNVRPGYTEDQIDRDAVLLRAYGRGTQVLIDRDREAASHNLLASYKLAPPLLARFNNGLLYRFLQGQVCQPVDIRRPEVSRAIARRLAEWHATLPISAISKTSTGDGSSAALLGTSPKLALLPSPNIWSVMQRWCKALPDETDAQRKRIATLETEIEWALEELGDIPGIDNRQFVFGHCDLLSANVIIEPSAASSALSNESPESSSASSPVEGTNPFSERELPPVKVSFIDYEYATPSPAAFDIANHFAEWGGFDCDFSVLPTKSQRRAFLSTYLQAYNAFRGRDFVQGELEQLNDEVDRFRGAPGLYWGIWALIQAQISQIDFDYANYAEVRLSEYWAWKETLKPTGAPAGQEIPLRERRWAEQ